jgi:hypothetical protein
VFVAGLSRAVAALGIAAAAATLTACGGGGSSASDASTSAAAAATVRTATCGSWTAASAEEQAQLVRGMREFFGGQVDSPGMHGQVLPDRQATQLFDSYCAESFAGAFSLYRLYGNAAAFTNPKK